MSFSDELMESVRLMGEAQQNAHRMGNEHGENARKLRRLIAAVERVAAHMEAGGWECLDLDDLRAAIEEAKR